MENFDWLLQGFAEAATPMNLLYAVIGVLLGTAVGVLPGIGPAMTVALLLPITYNVSPSAAFIMFACIFYGGNHYVRNFVVGLILALASFYAFYSGLGIPLPAGILDGIL